MKILGIETSTRYLGVAVAGDNGVLASFRDGGEARHSELLVPAIDGVLAKCRLGLKEIDVIALSIGPGSFTGLRIGVATVKGMNLALGTPIVAVPTLDVIAHNFAGEREEALCPVLDAKKGKVYAGVYENRFTDLPSLFYRLGKSVKRLRGITGYMLADAGSVIGILDRPTVVFGDGVLIYEKELKKSPLVRISRREWRPKAEVVAALGLEKAKRKEFADPDKLVPLYLHSKDCQVNTGLSLPAGRQGL